MTKPAVLIADDLAPECGRILQSNGIDVQHANKPKEDELVRLIEPFQGLIVRSAVKVTPKVVAAGKNLRIVGRAGIGIDNIDLESTTRRGILVVNTPLGNIASAAEHTWALLLCMARNVIKGHQSTTAGRWERNKLVGVEMERKILGIVGLGKVGALVARIAKGFGMRLMAYDPSRVKDKATELGVDLVDLETLLRSADFITVHVPLNEKTRGLIGARELGLMKPTARVVNTSRGSVIDELALVEALNRKQIAGAALDVFEVEPIRPDHPLLKCDNAIVTPHLGASTEEAQVKVSVDIAEQFVEFFKNGMTRHTVNMAAIEDPVLVPFMRLAGTLGQLNAQLDGGSIRSIQVTCSGEIASLDTSPVVASAVQGVLAPACGASVTVVNAHVVAKERGIEVIEKKRKESRGFKNMIRVAVQSDGKTRTTVGTLFEGTEPRIVEINGFEVDAKPAEHMVLLFYPDVPGVVGKSGSILGEEKINIARMAVGRQERGQRAMMVLTLDDPIPDAVLQRLRQSIPSSEILRVELA